MNPPPIVGALCLALSVGLPPPCLAGAADTTPVALAEHVAVGERYMGVRLLGALRLPDLSLKGRPLGGLSGLAWDEDDGVLYALSDLGHVFHLRPRFNADGVLADAHVLAMFRLQDDNGQPLHKPWADAEGLALLKGANGVRGDAELVVCFEVRQRIRRYSPTGKRLGEEPLPATFRDIRRFPNPNESLESVALHPRWGLLVAPELPLRGDPNNSLPLYALNGGGAWQYPLRDEPGSALVDMAVMPDGSLLTLERAFVSLFRPLTIALRRARLPAPGAGPLAVEDIALFSTRDGWLLDNFEGLAHHRGNRFFMVSDDNRSILQNTLLVYLEVL